MARPLTRSGLAVAGLLIAAGAAAPLAAQDYADRMYREHRHEAPSPSPAALVAPRAAVAGETVEYGRDGDKTFTGYFAEPAERRGDGMPAIIVVHEWWGLNDNIRAVADRYAGEGYTVLAVDLFGTVATTAEEARAQTRAAMQDVPAGERNVAAAIAWLKARGATSIGTVGFCFGGGWSLRTGLVGGSDVDAVVMYYGSPITDAAELARLEAPVLGHFGAQDRGIPLDRVRAMESAITGRGGSATIHVYDAGHAFANPSGRNYVEDAAETSWTRSLAFFGERLR